MERNVCIFGPWVDALFHGEVKGGAGLQMALLAKALASHGVQVTIIDPTARQDFDPVDNIHLRSVPGWNGGLPGLRLFTHRFPGLIRCLNRARGNAYYVRGISYLQLASLLVARFRKAHFIMAAAHDTDLGGFRERWAVHYKGSITLRGFLGGVLPTEIIAPFLLRGADTVLVQHEDQFLHAKAQGFPAVRLNNLYDGELLGVHPATTKKNVVLVGGLAARKNLASLIPVIESLPSVPFEFIGPVLDEEGGRVKRILEQFPNVKFLGMVDRAETVAHISSAKALINVSVKEGFANTFLEAWVLGTPVITLHVDPGGIIRKHGLGYVCNGDIQKLRDLLVMEQYDLDQGAILQYVKENHSYAYALKVFDRILGESGSADTSSSMQGKVS